MPALQHRIQQPLQPGPARYGMLAVAWHADDRPGLSALGVGSFDACGSDGIVVPEAGRSHPARGRIEL